MFYFHYCCFTVINVYENCIADCSDKYKWYTKIVVGFYGKNAPLESHSVKNNSQNSNRKEERNSWTYLCWKMSLIVLCFGNAMLQWVPMKMGTCAGKTARKHFGCLLAVCLLRYQMCMQQQWELKDLKISSKFLKFLTSISFTIREI